ncbi:hypothetical protein K435DRAFT_164903 [Dendrothele bispora CBS 962.96]|uniref:Uncharacterized protein n=1 Tax=Dendrothele bispora (strain CBS 962.96) TaxID=1314807 RepID=A0A4V4HFB0_DENBC|nr:hypothetical protein K435DRAFT_164903 [Dendrothele bispora CBS 962.96]
MMQLLKAPLWLQMHKCPPSSTQVNNTGATQTQFQSMMAHATSFATETSTSTATSPPSVPSTLSSSVSQADTTCILPESSFSTSVSTANTLAANNGRNANKNTGWSTTSTSSSSPRPPLPAKLRLDRVLRLQLVAVLPFHDLTYSNNRTQGTQEGASITRGGSAGTIMTRLFRL